MRNIFRTGRPTNLKLVIHTEHEDPHHRQAPWYTRFIPLRSKVKGQGRKVTWCVWQVLADTSWTKRSRKTKICRKVAHPTGNNAHQFKGQRSKVKVIRSTSDETGSASYLPKGEAYELLIWYTDYEDPYHRQLTPWPPRIKVKVARSRGPSDKKSLKYQNW